MDIHSWSRARPNSGPAFGTGFRGAVRPESATETQSRCTWSALPVANWALAHDTRGLAIHSVENAEGVRILGAAGPSWVRRAAFRCCRRLMVRVHYSTSPELACNGSIRRRQPANATHFSLRSRRRFTRAVGFHCRIRHQCGSHTTQISACLRALRAVMGAEMASNRFRMPQAIPSYPNRTGGGRFKDS